ncbi:Polysaccharide pyruvyl transferase [Opitutaceae bacterium TAV1]|nr:Polysaccharide pyruvyl transferase [Opitutaceae bacterium TAV1]
MKIGIITFHGAHNYGALLQAFALQEYIRYRNHQVEIIDYTPEYLTKKYASFNWRPLSGLAIYPKMKRLAGNILRLLSIPFIEMRRKGFLGFMRNRLTLSSKKVRDVFSIPATYDAIIFGSDQIWNLEITHGFDPVYWGDISIRSDSLKIAYGASAGANIQEIIDSPECCRALRNFTAISVRESYIAEKLKRIVDQHITTVLDPTFLVDKDVWDKIEKKPTKRRKYVLLYLVSESAYARKLAKKISRQLSVPVVELTTERRILPRKGRYYFATPEEFLGWFSDATCIITTSFHGTAFSIINRKEFWCVGKGGGGDIRSRALLKMLDLESRFILPDSACCIDEIQSTITSSTILWCDVSKRLEILKDRSRQYLSDYGI